MRRRVPATGVRAWVDPDPSADEIETIAGGVEVELLEDRGDGWVRVRTPDGRAAWVNGTVLLDVGPAEAVAVTEAVTDASAVMPAGSAAVPTTGPTSDDPAEPTSHRGRRLAVLAIIVLLLGGGAAALFLLSDSDDPDATPATPAPDVATTVADDDADVDADEAATPAEDDAPQTTESTTTAATTTTTLPPRIDPTIGWRWIDPDQFRIPGHQQVNDVVVHGEGLVAAGVSETFEPFAQSIPLPAGGSVTLLDWQITVTGAELDAADTIAAFDPENEPAPDEVRYVMINLEVTNLSSEEFRNVWADVEMLLATPDGVPLTRGAYCGSTLPDKFRSGPFDPNATSAGTECFSLLESDVRDDMVIGFAPAEAPLGQTDAIVWTSADGETWRVADAPALTGPGDQTITHLAVLDGVVYAGGTVLGDADRDAAIWRSTDGMAWDRIDAPALGGPGEQGLHDLVEIDGTLFAAGSNTPPLGLGEDTTGWEPDFHDYLLREMGPQAALWSSADGTTWERVELGSGGRGLATVNTVTHHGGNTALVGHHVDGDLAVLTSSDLIAWEPTALAPADTERWFPQAAAELDGRLHVLGAPGALSSADGITWELGNALSVRDAVPSDDVLLAVGRAGGYSIVGPLNVDGSRPSLSVIHSDGSWSSVSKVGLVPTGVVGELFAVTRFGDHFVAAGRVVGDGDDAGIWIGGDTEGSATAELYDHEPAPPGPPELPLEPTADLVHFDGAAWSVLDTGEDLTEEMESDFDVFDFFSRHLARDGSGALWAASTAAGVHRLDPEGWTRFDRADGLPSIQVHDMETDAAGTVWVGTSAGPAYFDGERWVPAAFPPDILHSYVNELAVAPDGTLWAASLGGLARWDGSGWMTYTLEDGLPSSVVVDVQPGLGGIWVVTPAGLGHFDGTTWTAFTDDAHRPYFEAYPYVSPLDAAVYYSPGLPERPDNYWTDLIRLTPDGSTQALTNTYSYKATALTPEGTLYVATDINGLYVVGAGVANVDSIEGVSLIHIGELWTAPNGEVWMDASQGLFQIHSVGLVTRHIDIPGLDYQLLAQDQGFQDGGVVDLVFGANGEVWALVNEQ